MHIVMTVEETPFKFKLRHNLAAAFKCDATLSVCFLTTAQDTVGS